MSTSESAPPVSRIGPDASEADPRRWMAMSLLALAQFMLVLDSTIVNVALPTIKTDLGFSTQGLAWVVNGYTLMAGGFLIVGGRIADVVRAQADVHHRHGSVRGRVGRQAGSRRATR